MSTFNKVIIVGFLGSDPETKTFENGGQVTNMTVASTENWKDKQTGEKRSLTEWSRIVVRGKLSELADKFLNKGSKVLIEGKLRTRKWTDSNGADKYVTEVHANNLVFMSSKKEKQSNQEPDDLPF